MLDFLGLDPIAERTYRLLLTRRDLDVEGMAGELSATTEEIRQALDNLAELTLLRPSWEVPGELRPVSPQVGMELLIQQRQAEMLRQSYQFAESQVAVAQLVQEYTDQSPGHGRPEVTKLMGMDAIQDRIEQLSLRAAEEVATLMPGGPQDPVFIEAAKRLDSQVRGRGVAMRTVGLESLRKDPPTLAYARWLTEIGAEVRTAPSLPIRMLIYDRRVALVPVDPDNSSLGALEVTDPGTVTVILALFEQIWSTSRPVGDTTPATDDDGLSPQERELLLLLSQGLTDERAGRQLGLSARSVRRMMAGLMERLGARSRFEAGLRAAENGWL
ncbi:LuxR C-terminal-related transcriptional regulator [Streptomyces sp. NPDC102259]|uniref:helix-turn-helix transcriptional regulator n=1 Tax=Streptomyces sp. NPDC102259 TaxID=3366148 RepID=UPI003802919D